MNQQDDKITEYRHHGISLCFSGYLALCFEFDWSFINNIPSSGNDNDVRRQGIASFLIT